MGCLLTQAAEMRLEKEEPGDARGSRRGQRLKGRILPAPTTLSDGNAAPNGPIVALRQGQARHSGDRSHVNRHLPPDGDINASPCSRRTRAHDGAVTPGRGYTRRRGKAWLLQTALISLEDVSESCTGLEMSPIIIMTHS